MSEVFDVYSDSPRFQNRLDSGHDFFRSLTKSSDDVHREWDRQDPSYSFDSRHEFIATNHLAIRVAERYHESCARSCNRRESFILKDACTWDIPRVGKNQDPFSMVKSTKILGLISLGSHLELRQVA